jgi:hypothetical protein
MDKSFYFCLSWWQKPEKHNDQKQEYLFHRFPLFFVGQVNKGRSPDPDHGSLQGRAGNFEYHWQAKDIDR